MFNQSLKYCVIALILLSANTRVEADGPRCSDLSEHEAVLKEGQGFVQPGNRDHWDARSPFFGVAETRGSALWGERVYSYELGELVLLSNLWSDEKIDALRISSASDISSAEWHARICELADHHTSARNIYSKVLTAKRSQKAPIGALKQTLKDIERVDLNLKIKGLTYTLSLYQVPVVFNSLTDCISENEYLDVRTKYQLLRSAFQSSASHFALPQLPAMKIALVRANSQLISYEKSLQCLDLADQLNAVGFKLEQQGLYPKAEKMYKEALKIRIKNLGSDDSVTLAEYGELARLQAAQKNYVEAIALYESSLANFRKLSVPGAEYGAMLQSYGDLLAQLKRTSKSNAIYDEARQYYSKSQANKS